MVEFVYKNYPGKNFINEIKIAKQLDFNCIEFEFKQSLDTINVKSISQELYENNLSCILHVDYMLTNIVNYKSITKSNLKEILKYFDLAKKFRCKKIGIHLDSLNSSNKFYYQRGIEMLYALSDYSRKKGIILMGENGWRSNIDFLKKIKQDVPGLKFLMDIGHLNLLQESNPFDNYIETFKDIIEHIHIHDNRGSREFDLHLPIGTGNIDWKHVLKLLRGINYNKTITLEFHPSDIFYLTYSRDFLYRMYPNCA